MNKSANGLSRFNINKLLILENEPIKKWHLPLQPVCSSFILTVKCAYFNMSRQRQAGAFWGLCTTDMLFN